MTDMTFEDDALEPEGAKPGSAGLFNPALKGPWRGLIAGEALGAPVTVLAYGTDQIGEGPRLHVHPYDEVFVVIEGRGRFFVGDTVVDATAGEVVFGPAGIPHRFENLGPGRLQTIDIHHSPRWIQTDLD